MQILARLIGVTFVISSPAWAADQPLSTTKPASVQGAATSLAVVGEKTRSTSAHNVKVVALNGVITCELDIKTQKSFGDLYEKCGLLYCPRSCFGGVNC